MTDNQERENFYHSSCRRENELLHVYEGFNSAVRLLNDSMKILDGLGIFNCVIFIMN